jgi:hypothetical protein
MFGWHVITDNYCLTELMRLIDPRIIFVKQVCASWLDFKVK